MNLSKVVGDFVGDQKSKQERESESEAEKEKREEMKGKRFILGPLANS